MYLLGKHSVMSNNSANSLNLISAVRFYIDKIVGDQSLSGKCNHLGIIMFVFLPSFLLGMKALLLDPATTRAVSMVYSQTQILEQEVYLVEQLNKVHEAMGHLKAAVLIQPTESNIEILMRELRDPKFSEYHIFFSNILPKDMLARLAKADEHDVVRQVQEFYADYLAINEDLFSLGTDNSIVLSSPLSRTLESSQIFDRNVRGILSLLLSVKRKPSQIRYQVASDVCKRTGGEISKIIDKDDIFDFRRQEGPLLLILDRRDDPITPLLTQWTYQAMVHELLGLNNNRVILKGAPGISKDLEEVILSCTQDDFFARNRYANFGDLGVAVKDMMIEYQKSAKMNENINSIEDMQAFMERYPAFRSKSINVSKHVAVMSELARLVDLCQLFDISQLEQDIACNSDHSGHKKELFDRIMNPRVQNADKLRLAVLFLLRYESYNETREIRDKLLEKGLSSQQLSCLEAVLEYAGESKRASGLFSAGGLMSKLTKSITSSINGVQNVYTQHQPVLYYILDSILKGKLKESQYPLLSGNSNARINEIVIFMIGGVTYEEAYKVAEFNAANNGFKVVLGGSSVHNSTSFLKDINVNFSN